MAEELKHPYRYLDNEEDRLALIEDIRQTRAELLNLVERLPSDQWYVPRYHGWSLAAMLGHLQLMDRLYLWLLDIAILGIQVPLPRNILNSFNDMMAGVFKQRVVETSLRGLTNNEKRISDFILRLPVDRFSKRVFDPASQKTYTVEQAIQEYFLYHWQEHLHTIRLADDIHYEPPTGSNIA